MVILEILFVLNVSLVLCLNDLIIMLEFEEQCSKGYGFSGCVLAEHNVATLIRCSTLCLQNDDCRMIWFCKHSRRCTLYRNKKGQCKALNCGRQYQMKGMDNTSFVDVSSSADAFLKSLTIDEEGNILYGTIANLADQLNSGAELKLSVALSSSGGDVVTFSPNFVSVDIFHCKICIRSIRALKVQNWDELFSPKSWSVFHICTDGKVMEFICPFGQHGCQSSKDKTADVIWFTRQNPDPGVLFSVAGNGAALEGSMDQFKSHVLNGQNIFTHVEVDGVKTRKTTGRVTVMESENVICEQNLDVASESNDSSHGINEVRYVDITRHCTNGARDHVLWNIGDDGSSPYSHNDDTSDVTWTRRGVWAKVYGKDSTGTVTYGSLQNLITAVQEGYKIRVVVQREYVFHADSWLFFGGNVFVMSTNNLETNVFNFLTNYTRSVVLISPGKVEIHKMEYGSGLNFETVTNDVDTDWFIDTYKWNAEFMTTFTGYPSLPIAETGSRQQLIAAILNGSDVVCMFQELYSNIFHFFSPDILRITADKKHASAQGTRIVPVITDEGDVNIHNDYLRWKFLTVTTEGKILYDIWVPSLPDNTYGSPGYAYRTMWFVTPL